MKIKILTIIGARPQIIKAAALSRAIRNKFSDKIEELILHTGQHYDANMSDVFIKELSIPEPDFNLNIGSGSHGQQTADMLTGIEAVLESEKPDALVVYGDTNSTLAGAIAASKLHVPLIHIEAGLRSFNKAMPEEVNRIMSDHVSTFLFSPTKTGVQNLKEEGFNLDNEPPYSADNPKVYHCGDVMFDNSRFFAELSDKHNQVFERLGLKQHEFALATVHRPSNTDNHENLMAIFRALMRISEETPVVLPLHPRTRSKLNGLPNDFQLELENSKLRMIDPASFLEMIALEKNAALVLTDSGGVQKEAYFFSKPCVILRDETEWTELVDEGAAILTGSDEAKILDAFNALKNKTLAFPPIFGDAHAAEFICNTIVKHF